MASSRTGNEKAAIVLLALGNDLGPKVLQKLDAEDVKRIMESATSIGGVDKDDLDRLVDEFAAQFAKSLGLSTGFDQVKSLVESAFPPGELNSLLGPEVLKTDEPIWGKFDSGSENALVPFLLDEHPQTVAFILSRIDADLAARCLSMLPGDMRDSTANRLLKIQPVSTDVESLIERNLERDLLARSDAGLEEEGRKRLASLLNKLDREQSAEIFEGLAATRPEEARRLRRLIFSFEDIDKLDQRSRLAIFDKLQTEQVIAALRGMPGDFKETALSSLGARARRMVEAELTGDTGETTKAGHAARRQIADIVLSMAARGEIQLPDLDDTSNGVAA
ncbi:MAG: flagellar motor switch protein FliG [Alphaproteobacteria bacterium]|nr:flagellar motor switch protein FliG [Alphaproteobacteria bacterium]